MARREAQELYAEVQRTFSGLTRVSEAAQRIGRNSAERLRVAIAPIFDAPPLARVTARFLDRHPDAFISLTSQSSPRIVEEIASGQHDVAIATLPIDRADVVTQTIADLEFHCLVPGGHPLSAQESIAPRDLEGARLIASADSSPVEHTVHRMLRDAGVRCSLRMETTTAPMAYALVAEGIGVSVALSLFAGHLPSAGVRAIPFHPRMQVGVAALLPVEHPPHPLAAGFVQMCSEALQGRSGGAGAVPDPRRVSGSPLPVPL